MTAWNKHISMYYDRSGHVSSSTSRSSVAVGMLALACWFENLILDHLVLVHLTWSCSRPQAAQPKPKMKWKRKTASLSEAQPERMPPIWYTPCAASVHCQQLRFQATVGVSYALEFSILTYAIHAHIAEISLKIFVIFVIVPRRNIRHHIHGF